MEFPIATKQPAMVVFIMVIGWSAIVVFVVVIGWSAM